MKNIGRLAPIAASAAFTAISLAAQPVAAQLVRSEKNTLDASRQKAFTSASAKNSALAAIDRIKDLLK